MSESTALAIQETPAPGRWIDDAQRVYYELQDEVEELRKASKSANTLRGYESDWQQFRAWGISKAIDIPAADDLTEEVPPAIVVSYLTARRRQVTSATLSRHLASIRFWHHKARMASPTDHPMVSEVMAGIVRVHRYDTDQATPIGLEMLRRMLARCGTDPLGLRNRSLLLLGWWSGMRRSELVGLDRSNVVLSETGIEVRITRSKTDQVGAGRTVAIRAAVNDPTVCAARALSAWIESSGIAEGALFRLIDRWGHISPKRLSGQGVAMVIKQVAESAGIDPRPLSGHSLRSGHISECVERGIPKMAIRAVTGHGSDQMIDLYSRPAELFEQSSSAYFTECQGELT